MSKSEKTIREFAMIGFVLLAVLFGMQIMTFIFGVFGSIDIVDATATVTNETGAWLNTTTYTVNGASTVGFNGGVTITGIWNYTGGAVIPVANYTLDSSAGTIVNATTSTYPSINISYTYNYKTEVERASESNTNDTLNAIGNYSTQSGTQFTTLGIAITLVLLVAVFLFFWQAFMGKGKKGEGPGSFS